MRKTVKAVSILGILVLAAAGSLSGLLRQPITLGHSLSFSKTDAAKPLTSRRLRASTSSLPS